MAKKNSTPIEQAGELLERSNTPATDDQPSAAAPEPAAAAPVEEPAASAEPEGDGPPERIDPRDALAKRFNEKRRREQMGETGEPGEGEPEAAAVAEPEGEPATPQARPAAPVTPADDPIYKIKVDHREIELPLS